jgi:hypothetical protein
LEAHGAVEGAHTLDGAVRKLRLGFAFSLVVDVLMLAFWVTVGVGSLTGYVILAFLYPLSTMPIALGAFFTVLDIIYILGIMNRSSGWSLFGQRQTGKTLTAGYFLGGLGFFFLFSQLTQPSYVWYLGFVYIFFAVPFVFVLAPVIWAVYTFSEMKSLGSLENTFNVSLKVSKTCSLIAVFVVIIGIPLSTVFGASLFSWFPFALGPYTGWFLPFPFLTVSSFYALRKLPRNGVRFRNLTKGFSGQMTPKGREIVN